MVEQQWDRKPDVCLSECLTEADTFATHKWCESQWVSGLTICRFCPLVVLILKVESFRLKLRWLRPLVRVVVNSVECDYDPLTSFKVNLEIFGANGGILAKSLGYREGSWGLNPQNFVVDLLKVIKLHYSVVVVVIKNII